MGVPKKRTNLSYLTKRVRYLQRKRKIETPEERNVRLQKNKIRTRESRAKETAEQREKRLFDGRIRAKKYRRNKRSTSSQKPPLMKKSKKSLLCFCLEKEVEFEAAMECASAVMKNSNCRNQGTSSAGHRAQKESVEISRVPIHMEIATASFKDDHIQIKEEPLDE